MDQVALPQESRKFIKIFLIVSLIWFVFGSIIHSSDQGQLVAFIQIFLFSFLDLIFLILLFWNIFFIIPEIRGRRSNKIRLMFFGFFKLVCLALLAITLKRLRNASASAHLMGVSIIWVGPLISGVCLKYFPSFKNN